MLEEIADVDPHPFDDLEYPHPLSSEEREAVLSEGIMISGWKIGSGNTRDAYMGFASLGPGGLGFTKGWMVIRSSVLVPKENIDQNSVCTLINMSKGDMNLREVNAFTGIGYHSCLVGLIYSTRLKNGLRMNVQELVLGEDSESFVKDEGDTIFYSQQIVSQFAQGLSHIHKKGYVHRDLKPSNLFFSYLEHGALSIKIGDFQNACRVDSLEDKIFPTRGGTAYTSFELLNSLVTGEPSNATQKTDVHAFGGTLYKLLTCEDPSRMRIEYDGENGTEITIGDKTIPISLFEVDERGVPIRRFTHGVDLRDQEGHIRKLSKRISQQYSSLFGDLIYCCMTPTNKGFNCGQELELYVQDHFPVSD